MVDSISDPTAPVATPEPARSPLDQIARLGRLGTDLTAAMAEHDRSEPTPTKATVALCAAATPLGTRPRDLLDLLDLSSGGITMLLDRLEGAGLIQRSTGQKPDRRAVTVTLTDLGRRELHERLEHTALYLAQIRSAVTGPDEPSVPPHEAPPERLNPHTPTRRHRSGSAEEAVEHAFVAGFDDLPPWPIDGELDARAQGTSLLPDGPAVIVSRW